VARAGGVELVVGQNLEGQVELAVELVLPLLYQHSGADDEATAEVTSDHEFLDEKPGHDGLSGPWVVGQQEAERLTEEHLLVDRRDLVGERVDQRGVHCEKWVEEVGEVNSVRLRDQPEESSVR